jgi:hypothetical protein
MAQLLSWQKNENVFLQGWLKNKKAVSFFAEGD